MMSVSISMSVSHFGPLYVEILDSELKHYSSLNWFTSRGFRVGFNECTLGY
jgi:hypothetical protein